MRAGKAGDKGLPSIETLATEREWAHATSSVSLDSYAAQPERPRITQSRLPGPSM
jgi:hypothetical protein